jgi:predicted RNase H-like nuclease (RuvC/YqgF family)
VSDKPLDLDKHRGMAAQRATDIRRILSEIENNAVDLRHRQEDVVAASEIRRLEERVRDLERMLGRKTMEVEILREAKAELAVAVASCHKPMVPALRIPIPK